jgi:hypothetical protein
MKTPLLVSLAAVLLAATGCDDGGPGKAGQATNSASSSSPSSGGSVLTAPVDYLGAVGQAKRIADKTIDTSSINQAIQMFQTDKGRVPTDLNELVRDKYLPYLPQPPYGTKYEYDANLGQVKVVKN